MFPLDADLASRTTARLAAAGLAIVVLALAAATVGNVITLTAFVFGLGLLSVCAWILVTQLRQVSKARAREIESLRHAAGTDPLTGVRNQRAFQADLTRETHRANRAGARVALVMFDLDGLKGLNDTLGHQAGDDQLKALADALHAAARASDAVYRVGGDEFIALLPDTGAWDASVFAKRVQLSLATDTAGGASATAGVADALPFMGKEALIRRADLALIEAKGSHRAMLIYSADSEPGHPNLAAARSQHHAKLASALALAVEAKDPSTLSHSHTVSELAAQIALQMGFDPERVAHVRLAGLLHDVGKIGVPDAILHKPAKLTDDEYAVIKTHSTLGHKIILASELDDEAGWVLHRHERIDGRGYPHGLHDQDIPLEAKILAVADTYEAIISDRPYRAGQPPAAAFAELRRCAGTQFDSDCVEALHRAIGEADSRPPAAPDLVAA
jgi:diguanylate cyclase (GGDEF)-like protein/putative nucleotidyltransferase with HDIG domain